MDETFQIADLLLYDQYELVQKALGSWIREAGKKDQQRLLDFLDKYTAVMSRSALRYAVEHLEEGLREYYLKLKKENQ